MAARRRPVADVGAYLASAAPPLRAALATLDRWLRTACPDATVAIKWSRPAYVRRSLLAGMAAFKAHATFGFWKDALLRDDPARAAILDQLGRIDGPEGLPSQAQFHDLVRRAVALDDGGVAVPRRRARKKPPLRLIAAFRGALAANPAAKAVFDGFPPSCRREYAEWIAEAKQAATRDRRIGQAIAWLRAGKRRNWRYER